MSNYDRAECDPLAAPVSDRLADRSVRCATDGGTARTGPPVSVVGTELSVAKKRFKSIRSRVLSMHVAKIADAETVADGRVVT